MTLKDKKNNNSSYNIRKLEEFKDLKVEGSNLKFKIHNSKFENLKLKFLLEVQKLSFAN